MLKDRVVVATLVGWLFAGALAAAPQNHVLSLDGLGDYVMVPASPSLNIVGPYTIEAWVSPQSGNLEDVVVSKGSGTSRQYYMGVGGASVRIKSSHNWIHNASASSNCVFNAGATGWVWTHYAVAFDGSVVRMFVNGSQVQSCAMPVPHSNAATSLGIGLYVNQILGDTYFDGRIDEVRLWNVARTASEIAGAAGIQITGQNASLYPGLVSVWGFENGAADELGLNSGSLVGDAAIVVAGDLPLGPQAASASAYGVGCGAPALSLVPGASPVIGSVASATISNAPLPFGGVTLGFSNTALGGLPILPFSLTGLGMPGCFLWHSNEISGLPIVPVSPGVLSFSAAIPGNVSLLGTHVYLQAYCVDPNASPRKLITSNGVDWAIGNQ